jgi:predicted ATPase/DNA-binding CsgD family transcriptional regulator
MLDGTGDTATASIEVGSPLWFAWLNTHSSFRFESPDGSFSARKEFRSGNPYWYAYRKRQGKRVTTYIGKPEEVSGACLRTVAGRLTRLEDKYVKEKGALGTPPGELPGAKSRLAGSKHIARGTSARHRLCSPPPVPLPAAPLVDRVHEMATMLALLRRADVRVVSLIGPGGIGKTRLAIEAASDVQADFVDGVYFLTVDSVRDPRTVLARVAQLFGLSPDGNSSVGALLSEALQHRELLIVLDNLEQVPTVVPLLDELVSACEGLKLLVTSREVLHFSGEHNILVGPLRFPNPDHLPQSEDLLTYPAIKLFVHRASAIAPDLAVLGPAMDAIARICARLDGLPLAIELAAARVRLLSPEDLLERLAHRLAVLTGGGRERPARHQTLRATLDWSYDLLSQDEQIVLRRLAVFSGGCDVNAAEAVCCASVDLQLPILDILASLLDKSLVLSTVTANHGPRLSLLETVREYALERLGQSGELQAARTAHAEYYISVAQQAGPGLYGEQQFESLARLDQDDLNFSAALAFLVSEQDYISSAVLIGELGRFWFLRGRLSEGLGWAEQVLYAPAGEAAAPRNRQTLFAAGLLAMHLDQGERAQDWLRESFELSKAAEDGQGLARAAHILSLFHLLKGNLAAAQAQAEELYELARGRTDPWTLALVEYTSGVLTQYCGDFLAARVHLERSAALFAEAADVHLRRMVLLNLADALLATGERSRAQLLLDEQIEEMKSHRWGWTAGYMLCAHGRFAMSAGDWSRARVLLEKALSLFEWLQDVRGIARASLCLAQVALYQQDYVASIKMARRCLANAQAVGANATIIGCIEELADVAMRRGKLAWAVQLWAAGERQRHLADPHHCPAPSAERAHLVASARDALGERAFHSTWEKGHTLPLEQLLSVENVASSMQSRSGKAIERPAGLTARELEVLLLLARGLSNGQIAQELVISPTTVVSYLNVIYRKLDVSSRTAAMRYVIDHHLVSMQDLSTASASGFQ